MPWYRDTSSSYARDVAVPGEVDELRVLQWSALHGTLARSHLRRPYTTNGAGVPGAVRRAGSRPSAQPSAGRLPVAGRLARRVRRRRRRGRRAPSGRRSSTMATSRSPSASPGTAGSSCSWRRRCATSLILSSASEKPSARRIAAWRSPSAFRMAACFCPSAFSTAAALLPSATVTAACFAPSASVTTARRVRSADICRVMASWTAGGGMISRISTFVTFTPQRSVTSSSFVAEDLVHLLALGQHVVERHVADHRAQRGRRDVLRGAREVPHGR